MPTVRIVGPGRAGRSLSTALQRVGWEVAELRGSGDDLTTAADGVEAVVLATPDGAIAPAAAAVRPGDAAVVHLSGSLGLDVLAPHRRRASMHPLVPLPTPAIGAERLLAGASFAVAGDPIAVRMVEALGGRPIAVADEDRVAYHAAACIAANHVVALLGQVQRIAASIGLELEDFLGLARAALDDAERLGPAGALTGPAARGDWTTIDRHLGVLESAERAGYAACAGLALLLTATGDEPKAHAR